MSHHISKTKKGLGQACSCILEVSGVQHLLVMDTAAQMSCPHFLGSHTKGFQKLKTPILQKFMHSFFSFKCSTLDTWCCPSKSLILLFSKQIFPANQTFNYSPQSISELYFFFLFHIIKGRPALPNTHP